MPSLSPTVSIPIPTQGLQPNLPPLHVGWKGLTDAKNVLYRNGHFFVRPGLTDFANDINQRPMGLHQFNNGSNDFLVMGTTTKMHRYDTGTQQWVDISGAKTFTGGNTAQWVFRSFEKSGTTYLLGCNGADSPIKWSGSGDVADIAGSPPVARCMAVSADRLLLAINMNVYVSSNLNFDTGWGSELVARVADTPGDIMSMLEFGNEAVAVYKTSKGGGSIYLGYAQEDLTKTFSFELVRAGLSGPCSPLSVFPLGESGGHCYLAENGAVMVFEGGSPHSMGESLQAHIQATRSYDQRGRSWGFYRPKHSEIFVFYTAKGGTDVNTCVVVHYPSGRFHRYHFDNHALSAGGAFVASDALTIGEWPLIGEIELTFGEMESDESVVLMGDYGGQVYTHSGTSDDGSAIQFYAETGLKFLGPTNAFQLVKESEHLFPRTAQAQLVSVQFGVSDYGEERALDDAQTIDLADAGPLSTGHHLPGRMYSLRLSGSADQYVEWLGSAISPERTVRR